MRSCILVSLLCNPTMHTSYTPCPSCSWLHFWKGVWCLHSRAPHSLGEQWCNISMMQADYSDEDGYGLEAARQALELCIDAPSGKMSSSVLMHHQTEV